jgi:hypothetical protein
MTRDTATQRRTCWGHLVEYKGMKFSITPKDCECRGKDVRIVKRGPAVTR